MQTKSNRITIHGYIAFQRIRGYTKCKAIGYLVMEILYFKDFEDTASVVTNAVVLVFGECQYQRASG